MSILKEETQETFLTKQTSSHVEASVPRVMMSAWDEQMSACAEEG